MANKFLGEAGVDVLVNEIKRKSTSEQLTDFEKWMKKFDIIQSIDGTSPTEEEWCALIAITVILQNTTAPLYEIMRKKFGDRYNPLSGTNDEWKDYKLMFQEALEFEDGGYMGLPLRLMFMDNDSWRYLTCAFNQDLLPSEITADEVTGKFNS